MPRLTISLSEERHLALKETAARRGRTIGQLIEESLEACGIKSSAQARAIVEVARKRSGLRENAALRLAVRESRAARRR
jgi:hypothetical protein